MSHERCDWCCEHFPADALVERGRLRVCEACDRKLDDIDRVLGITEEQPA